MWGKLQIAKTDKTLKVTIQILGTGGRRPQSLEFIAHSFYMHRSLSEWRAKIFVKNQFISELWHGQCKVKAFHTRWFELKSSQCTLRYITNQCNTHMIPVSPPLLMSQLEPRLRPPDIHKAHAHQWMMLHTMSIASELHGGSSNFARVREEDWRLYLIIMKLTCCKLTASK